MSKAIRLSEDMVGKKVRMINRKHSYSPENGSIGIIVDYDSKEIDMHYRIQWNLVSTPLWAEDEEIEEVVDDNTDMTNDEIWQMLENKMRKNGLVAKISIINTHVDNYPNNEVEIAKAYYENDVHNAIALAYKVGYLRSQKGRPFKFSEKKGVTE